MRLVRLLVDVEDREALARVLDEEGIDFVAVDEHDGDAVVVEFPLPVQAVDTVLETLDEAGLGDSEYTVVASAEMARTERFDELEAEYVESDAETDSVSGEEIRATARSLLPDRRTYYSMTVLSALVATAGILLNSPAVVIGSMAIAPQVGAAITASTGIVLGERRMIRDGVESLALGLLVATVAATAFGLFLHETSVVSPALDVSTVEQISTRISPGFLSLLLGLCAGSAAALGLATDLPLSLVGVAIAAAVVPAAAAVGIGLVWSLPLVALGAAVLLVINAAAILLAGAATLRTLGYHTGASDGDGHEQGAAEAGEPARGRLLAAGTVLALLLVVSVPAIPVVEHVGMENSVNGAVQETLERPAYEEISLRSVDVGFTDLGLLDRPTSVTVRVSRPADRSYPTLAEDLGERIARRTGVSVDLSVEFVEEQAVRTSAPRRGRLLAGGESVGGAVGS
ncbi:DUF389 domain-containing protein [Haloglomus litoreum]|uniref:DUF389 domain-containing protein n=1 Tax=Haloglomus litoreum TaxID=3034026 RepID=UPI0023E89561|nr:DUF389 domain-containing protein [Haloglomus sp. DT116]